MKASFAEPEVVNKKGEPVSVIVPIKPGNAGASRRCRGRCLDEECPHLAAEPSSAGRRAGRPRQEVAMYQIAVERSAEKDLKKLAVFRSPPPIQVLAKNPRPPGSRKLAFSWSRLLR